ncbi:MAG: glycosyltransferase family 2 protein [Phycisphaeraceae bacterium]|nr:glycosyltransferase family 2 protein [Phycisphaeraceae bacterium]
MAPVDADACAAPATIPVSVLVLTKNEQVNIVECLRDLQFSDDVVVLDSLSTDKTVELAKQFANVRVFERPFDTEYKQRNFGLHDIAYKHPWLYICDADERVPADLMAEIRRIATDPSPAHVAYRLRYKNMYLGKWIKHATSYPVWLIRMVQPKRVTYEKRETNVHPIVDGTVGEMRSHFIHYSYNNGLRHWFEKHNFYSDHEASEAVGIRQRGLPRWREIRQADPIQRRRAVKNVSFFLRGRAVWRFLYQYLLRFGFLDGKAGFHYCAMISMYEYWIELKIRELESDWRSRTDELARKLLEAPAS